LKSCYPRICRISPTFPRETRSGSGLVPYEQSNWLEYETLYLTHRVKLKAVSKPKHVKLIEINYPDPYLPQSLNNKLAIFPIMLKLVGILWFTVRVLPLIHRFQPDIIHVHTPLQLLPAIIWKRFTNTPLILQLHGTDFQRIRVMPVFITRIFVRFVDAIIVVSKKMLPEVSTMFPGKRIVYIPNGVNFDTFQATPFETRKKQVVAVGMLKWQKGYEYMLQAWAKIVEKFPDYKLIILGDGPLKDEINKLAISLDIKKQVSLIGTVSHKQVAECLNSSQLYLMSSVTEGFPKAVIEAMACGTPVIVTNVGSCAEIAQNAGRIVPPKNVENFAEAIEELLTSPLLSKHYSQQAVVNASKYSWPEVTQHVANLYQELLV
jgi:glycosyltransferase involved in cell wall biosynthesis